MSTEKKRVKELNQSIQNQFVDMCGGSKNSRALSNLLKSGRCRVNAQDSKGNTPLTTAVLRDNGLIRDFLLAYEGINPNAPDKFGKTPLIYSAQYNHPAAAQALVDAKADVNFETDHGKSALIYAAADDSYDTAVVLIK